MSNELEPLLICQSDFDCIAQVAQSCDWDQLSKYIREQQNLSLLARIGFCVFDKLLRWKQGFCMDNGERSCTEQETDVLKHLWIGGRYKSCNGELKMHFGLKRVLIHWSYGAYAYRHSLVDTPFGVVQKVHQDSVPVDPKDLSKMNTEHRNNAEYYFEMTKDYLCSVKNCPVLVDCNICDCNNDCNCMCNHCKKKGTQQRRGVKLYKISKD